MPDKPPYTLEQVSRQLGLSEAVVRRVSSSLHLPVLFYPAEPGKPKLMLYSDLEVDILKRVQALLIEGYSIEEAQASLKDLLTLSHHQPELLKDGVLGLVDYEDDGMKARLAQSSLAQYRAAQVPKKPVFQSMMDRVAKAASIPVKSAPPFGSTRLTPGWVAPANSWMSPAFQISQKP
jgi:hypothetical protein